MSFIIKFIDKPEWRDDDKDYFLHKIGYSINDIAKAERFKTREQAQERMDKYCEPYYMKTCKYEIMEVAK